MPMKNRFYWILGGALILGLGIVFGAGVLYFGLQTTTVQAAASLQATVVPTVAGHGRPQHRIIGRGGGSRQPGG